MDYKGLKEYFKDEKNIKDNIKIDKCTTIVNGKLFIESSFLTLDANSGNKYFIPYYERLLKYYNVVSK